MITRNAASPISGHGSSSAPVTIENPPESGSNRNVTALAHAVRSLTVIADIIATIVPSMITVIGSPSSASTPMASTTLTAVRDRLAQPDHARIGGGQPIQQSIDNMPHHPGTIPHAAPKTGSR